MFAAVEEAAPGAPPPLESAVPGRRRQGKGRQHRRMQKVMKLL